MGGYTGDGIPTEWEGTPSLKTKYEYVMTTNQQMALSLQTIVGQLTEINKTLQKIIDLLKEKKK